MNLFDAINERVKKLTIWDIKLLQIAAIFVALIIVKLIPSIIQVSIWWFVILALLTGAKPFIKLLKNS
ncbi:MAG: hypothetical protein H8E82_00795 [Candidatus Marinimicrobia bacterium]|nr:hypothetical protein [Candidatus Neomarinimicrobiota bacterium]MBL7047229.1 hypothetical protein [Candidatus Neomarinimicrobiota bacterium]